MTSAIANLLIVICVIAIIQNGFAQGAKRQRREIGNCGIPKISKGLVRGGSSTKRGEFPWFVAFLYTSSFPPVFGCSGTLISHTFVITGKNLQEKIMAKICKIYVLQLHTACGSNVIRLKILSLFLERTR